MNFFSNLSPSLFPGFMGNESKLIREFGKFRLDVERKVLWHEHEPVNLPLKEIELLCALTENGGEVITKNELMEKVWADSFVEESNLSRHIYLLRKTFNAYGESEELIQTVPRRGYRFAGQIREVGNGELIIEKHTLSQTLIEEIPDHQLEQTITPQTLAASSTGQSLSRIFQSKAVVFGAILLAIIAAGVVWRRFNQPNARTAAPVIKSIAVLPLKSFTSDAENEPLRLRITDALITRLGGLKDVAVRPTSSVLRFAGEGQDVIEAGKMLGVDAVLDGRVQAENDRLRVTLQLVSVRDGEQLWAEQFDGRAGETLALQDVISTRLRQKFAFAESEEPSRRPTENNEAYEAYLKGRYLWNQRTAEAYWKALDYFQQSVGADPNFALGYTGIADCYVLLEQRNVLPANEAFQKAEAAARRALELDSTIAEAHASMGVISHLSHRDWTGAEYHYRKAIELNPNYSGASAYYGMLLNAWGRFDEAFARLKEAERLDPTSLNIGIYLGANFYFSKQFEMAIGQFNRVLEFAPGTSRSYFFLTRVYELNGRFDEAVEAELKTRVPSHPESVEPLRASYQGGGIRGFWQKQIETLKKESRDEHGLDYHIASRYALLGQADNALAYIKKNQTSRGSMWNMLKVDPSFDSLRSNPKFQELLSSMIPPN